MKTSFEILPIESYKIRYHGRNGERRYRRFPTKEKAIELIAWWMIFDKYVAEHKFGSQYTVYPKHTPPYICDCAYGNTEYPQPEWLGCPLHDRVTGYFTRVHRRLVRYINTVLYEV